jgi:glycosyltransferase involved in cell wall biosynthesis
MENLEMWRQKEGEIDLKILHLISGGDTGGAKTHIISLLKGLNKRIDARIICFIEDTFYEDVLAAGIPIKVFKQKSRSDMSVIRRLTEEINQEGYDIIHCHGARANFIAQFLKGRVKKPFMTTIHSDYKLDFKDNFYKRLVYTTLNTISLRRFDYFVAVSDSFREMLISRGFKRDRIFVTYNGIDMGIPGDYVTKEEFLNRYGIEDQGLPLVGILARLDKVKDHRTFIEAAKHVLKTVDANFLIAGDGADEESLRDLVREYGLEKRIHFIGFVSDPYSFFNAIDINVLTSVSESFPYVILEGARMKKPVVSTEVGGIGRLVDNGENGFLCQPGDWGAIGERIISLIIDNNMAGIMGERLHQAAAERFSYDSMADSHIKMYTNILSMGPRIVMSGYFGFDNSGDDAILKAIVKDLREYDPSVRIKVLSKDPYKTEQLCPVISANRFKLREVIDAVKESDLVISGGGSLLQDVTSTRSLLYYLALMKLAMLLR